MKHLTFCFHFSINGTSPSLKKYKKGFELLYVYCEEIFKYKGLKSRQFRNDFDFNLFHSVFFFTVECQQLRQIFHPSVCEKFWLKYYSYLRMYLILFTLILRDLYCKCGIIFQECCGIDTVYPQVLNSNLFRVTLFISYTFHQQFLPIWV